MSRQERNPRIPNTPSQFVYSAQLSQHRCVRITARIADKTHVVIVARAAEMDARNGGFGGQTASTRPKRRFWRVGGKAADGWRDSLVRALQSSDGQVWG
jgi:hypothetical protein